MDRREPRSGKAGGPLEVAVFRCEPVAAAEPQALGLSYWFDAAPQGEPYAVTIRFTGRRIGVKGKPGRRDSFNVTETVDPVLPGSGRIAVTTRVSDVAPGDWHVTAAAVRDPRDRAGAARRPGLPNGSSSGVTGFAPIIRVRAPGARLGAWPALVSLGVVIALVTQSRLAAHAHLDGGGVLVTSLTASVVGLVTAKLYYLIEHRDTRQDALTAGMCIQGFVLGAIATLAGGGLLTDMPVGRLLDATAPGLLFGMTVGRFGCFFGGCCAGRPTASRWGLWSSDRRLGTRRIPTQLIEAAVALAVGLAALGFEWAGPPAPAGVVFVGALAAYTLGRQLLFPLRDLPRHTANGRTLTAALAALVIAVDLVVALVV